MENLFIVICCILGLTSCSWFAAHPAATQDLESVGETIGEDALELAAESAL